MLAESLLVLPPCLACISSRPFLVRNRECSIIVNKMHNADLSLNCELTSGYYQEQAWKLDVDHFWIG